MAIRTPAGSLPADGMQQLELRWYGDWRWRVTSDRAGFAVWCGPVALFWWRRIDPVV